MTYLELQTQIADYLKRKNLDSQIPDFITLGEIMLRDGIEVASNTGADVISLRVRDMEVLKTYSAGDTDTDSATASHPITVITLPAVYLEPRYLMHGTNEVSRSIAQTVEPLRSSSGKPELFYRVNNTMRFGPKPTATDDVTLSYYADFTGSLSADSDTNAILTNYPNLYLYAALMAAEPYLFNDQRMQVWMMKLVSGIRAANRSSDVEMRSGGRKVMGRTF